MTNTYASGAQNVGVRLLDNAEANITLGAAMKLLCWQVQPPKRCTLKH
jgi:type 1 fimbria pilin